MLPASPKTPAPLSPLFKTDYSLSVQSQCISPSLDTSELLDGMAFCALSWWLNCVFLCSFFSFFLKAVAEIQWHDECVSNRGNLVTALTTWGLCVYLWDSATVYHIWGVHTTEQTEQLRSNESCLWVTTSEASTCITAVLHPVTSWLRSNILDWP